MYLYLYVYLYLYTYRANKQLWTCGRDRATCQQDHTLEPVLLEDIDMPVKAVAVGGHHNTIYIYTYIHIDAYTYT